MQTIRVVGLVVLISSAMVSTTAVLLRPLQLDYQLLQRGRSVLKLTGLTDAASMPADRVVVRLYNGLDARMLDIDAARFTTAFDPQHFDQREAAQDAALSVAIPAEFDTARLGRRSRYAPVHVVWRDGALDRLILPIKGKGMWSMLYGYIALEPDLNTIADATFYEQNETPGLGDQVTRPEWLATWRGRKIYDERGQLRFAVAGDRVDPGAATAVYHVDALTGATVTGNAVTRLMRYWFGPHGYQPFLQQLRAHPPAQPARAEDGARP